jgi:hypothetical protein
LDILRRWEPHQFIGSANHDAFHIPQPMQGWLIAQIRHLNGSTNTGKFPERAISEKDRHRIGACGAMEQKSGLGESCRTCK